MGKLLDELYATITVTVMWLFELLIILALYALLGIGAWWLLARLFSLR